RIQCFFDVLRHVTLPQLSYVLWLSFLRFVIFTSQYILLMVVILPDMDLLPMVMMIFILFFVQSALPTLDFFDFSVRSFLASNLCVYMTTHDIAVMAIVSFIWFFKLLLPVMYGSFFVLNVNYLSDNSS